MIDVDLLALVASARRWDRIAEEAEAVPRLVRAARPACSDLGDLHDAADRFLSAWTDVATALASATASDATVLHDLAGAHVSLDLASSAALSRSLG